MGLDMHLYAGLYLSKYSNPKKAEQVRKIFDMYTDSVQVKFEIGYWRKANQIHNWFVNNCQDGKDECQESDVSREKLIALKDLCKKALSSKKPEIILPNTSGFFFGSQEYDEYYKQGLEQTIKIIDQALTLSEDFDFTYRASW